MNDSLIIAAVVSTIAGIFFGLWSDRYKIFQNQADKNRLLLPSQQKSISLPVTSNNYSVKEKKDSKQDYNTVKEKKVNENEANIFKKSAKELREDLKVLQFEKKIAAKSLQDIFDARKQGKIDVFEFDRLVVRYKKDLAFYNQKIDKIAAELDFSELFALRNEIDEKIGNLKIKYNLQNLSDDNKMDIQKILDLNKEFRKEMSELDDDKNNRYEKQQIDSHPIDKEELMIEKFKDDVTRAIERLDTVKLDIQSEIPVITEISERVVEKKEMQNLEKTLTVDEGNKRNDIQSQIAIDRSNKNQERNEKNTIESNFASPLSFIYTANQKKEKSESSMIKIKEENKNLDINEYNSSNKNENEKSKKIDSGPLSRIIKH